MLKFVTPSEFKREVRLGSGTSGVQLGGSVRAIDAKTRTARFTFSTGDVDRQRDTINQRGWILRDFLRNPIALYQHNSAGLPIGKASNLVVTDNALIGDISFARAETVPLGDTVWRCIQDGLLNACSVGFLPVEWSWSRDPARPGGIDFRRQALAEISIVTVPANANALLEGRGARDRAGERRLREVEVLRLTGAR